MYTFKDLKELSIKISNVFKIEYDDAARLVASFSAVGDWETVKTLSSGDYTPLYKAAPGLDIELKPLKEKTAKKADKPVKRPMAYKTRASETVTEKEYQTIISNVKTEYAAADAGPGELPLTLCDDIKTMIKAWADDNGIEDINKCASLQWRAVCIYIGWWINENGFLLDYNAMRSSVGGCRVYDGEKVSKLLDIFQYLCLTYRHLFLHTDFISFSGVRREWFFDYERDGLTSTGAHIVKKALAIENASLSAGVTDSRENPTGRIFYAKARLGWRENDYISPLPEKQSSNALGLPTFDD